MTQFGMPWNLVIKTYWIACRFDPADVPIVTELDHALRFRATKIASVGLTSKVFLKSEDLEEDLMASMKRGKFFRTLSKFFQDVAGFVATCWQLVNDCYGKHANNMLLDFSKAFTMGALE